jgi:hypothetical protein
MWGTHDERRGSLPRLRGRTFGSASGRAHEPNQDPCSECQTLLQRSSLSAHAPASSSRTPGTVTSSTWATCSTDQPARLRPSTGRFRSVINVDDVRAFALTLPRTTDALVRDRVKFRVGRIVYLAFSHDETIMGFAFPRDEREALVRSEPHKFLMPDRADLRYQWVQVRLDAIDEDEMRELVLDAWRMVVPKRVAAEHAARG